MGISIDGGLRPQAPTPAASFERTRSDATPAPKAKPKARDRGMLAASLIGGAVGIAALGAGLLVAKSGPTGALATAAKALKIGGAVALGAALLTSCAGARPQDDEVEGLLPDAPPAVPKGTLRVAQLNAHNFMDTKDDAGISDFISYDEGTGPVVKRLPTRAEFNGKLDKLSMTITDVLGSPDVIALEEVENIKVLEALAKRPELAKLGYTPILVEGSDPRGIDVAFLYRKTRVTLVSSSQQDVKRPSGAGMISLFTRPPLVATFRPKGIADAASGAKDVTMIVNHFTSKIQGEEGEAKRLMQAQAVTAIADGTAGVANLNPARVIVIGDLNEGVTEPAYRSILEGNGRTHAFRNAADHVEKADRYSYRQGNKRDLLDHVLLTPELDEAVQSVHIPHISSEADELYGADRTTPLRVSDHDPVIVDIAA